MSLPVMSQIISDSLLDDYVSAKVRKINFGLHGALGDFVALGIDPGQVNMGVAVVTQSWASLFQIELPGAGNSIERIMIVTELMQHLLEHYCPAKPHGACIEGAAYMAPYGQVPLETARTSAAIAILNAKVWPTWITPPKTVREAIFGNGQYRAQEVWPDLPPDAASAYGCALYAYDRIRKEQAAPSQV